LGRGKERRKGGSHGGRLLKKRGKRMTVNCQRGKPGGLVGFV